MKEYIVDIGDQLAYLVQALVLVQVQGEVLLALFQALKESMIINRLSQYFLSFHKVKPKLGRHVLEDIRINTHSHQIKHLIYKIFGKYSKAILLVLMLLFILLPQDIFFLVFKT